MTFIEKLCKYREMQNAVVKPGQDILASLTPERVNQWHMLTGLQDESTEFKLAASNYDYDNMLEEVGDFIFYAIELLYSLEFSADQLNLLVETAIVPAKPLQVETDVMGTLKKYILYNKELSAMQTFMVGEQLIAMVAHMHQYISDEAHLYDYDKPENFKDFFECCLQLNREKLLTGKNARYKEGGYSDAQAQERRDKQ